MTKSTQSLGMLVVAVVLVVCISAGHYMTDAHDIVFHNVYRRLYYVPVVLAAFALGLRGGLGAALVTSLAYIPHAFFMTHHMDPAPKTDKVFEIVLYFGVGALTGWLVERERASKRSLERSLQRSAELEQELVRAGKLSALGELLSGVAHEVRNPLAAIMGAAEALERKVDPSGQEHRLVELQLKEVARLDRVVSNFLAFSKPGPPHRTRFELEALLSQLTELTQHQQERGEFVLDDSLGGVHLVADADQVSQILLNLTLNAMQAARGERFHVTFHWKRREIAGQAYDCVGVSDQGHGVAPEHLELIFNPYFTTRESGSGLGLSLSSRLAEGSGGFLEVESQEGETTFWLCLPQEAKG